VCKMTKPIHALLVSAALAGLVAGQIALAQSNKPDDTKKSEDQGKKAAKDKGDKHACKGQNSCKGKGGCGKTKGKNDCKGKGECSARGGCLCPVPPCKQNGSA
jgi:hypothetical protein